MKLSSSSQWRAFLLLVLILIAAVSFVSPKGRALASATLLTNALRTPGVILAALFLLAVVGKDERLLLMGVTLLCVSLGVVTAGATYDAPDGAIGGALNGLAAAPYLFLLGAIAVKSGMASRRSIDLLSIAALTYVVNMAASFFLQQSA